MEDNIDPPLIIIRPPRPPQKMLLAPKSIRVKSASDMPVYKDTAYPSARVVEEEIPGQRHVSAVLKAAAPARIKLQESQNSQSSDFVNLPSTTVSQMLPQFRASLPKDRGYPRKGLNSGFMPSGSNWISNLMGKTFSDAMPVMIMHRLPYRIVQIDGIMMDNSQKVLRAEIFITIRTNEEFKPSISQTKNDRERDRLRAGAWFSQNMNKSIISCAKLSQ
jgi:hypothetical protein